MTINCLLHWQNRYEGKHSTMACRDPALPFSLCTGHEFSAVGVMKDVILVVFLVYKDVHVAIGISDHVLTHGSAIAVMSDKLEVLGYGRAQRSCELGEPN